MRSLHATALSMSLALALTALPGQAATTGTSPRTPSAGCPAAARTMTPAAMDRHERLRNHAPLLHMIEAMDGASMLDITLRELAHGLSDEAVELLVTTPPIHPTGPPIPTFAPPLPFTAAEVHTRAAPAPECHRELMIKIVYSWWSSGICALFAVATTIVGGWACGAIAWGTGEAMDWAKVCRMTTIRLPATTGPRTG